MTAKGKTDPLPPVSLTTQYPGELWAEAEAELKRRLAEEHRDDGMADLIREGLRKLLADQKAKKPARVA